MRGSVTKAPRAGKLACGYARRGHPFQHGLGVDPLDGPSGLPGIRAARDPAVNVVEECRVGHTIDARGRAKRPVILVQQVAPLDQLLTARQEELAPVAIPRTPGVGEAEANPLFRGLDDQIDLAHSALLPP